MCGFFNSVTCLSLGVIITMTVTVHYVPFVAKPSPPVVSGPTGRAPPGQTVSFTCESHGFSPQEITLKWFKDGNELPASQTTVDPEGASASYSVSSAARLVLAPGDVRSQLVCEVDHVTLQGGPPLRGTANLSETIRGRCPPTQTSPHLTPNLQACSSPCFCSRPRNCLGSNSRQSFPSPGT